MGEGARNLATFTTLRTFTSVFRCAYLHAICITCMHTKWACARCDKNDWFLGSALIVGTLYTYDVLSTSLCCPPICRICLSPVLMTDWQRSSMEKVRSLFKKWSECRELISAFNVFLLSGVKGSVTLPFEVSLMLASDACSLPQLLIFFF